MSVRFFSKELHGTPHECSKCHTSADFKFVYHFHRNVHNSFDCSQSAPGSLAKGGCSGSLIFTVLSAPPLPQVHRVRGGRGLFLKAPRNIGGHQVCFPSTVSSLWKVVHLEQHHQVHLVRGTFYTFERMLLVTPCSQPNLPSTEGSVVTA